MAKKLIKNKGYDEVLWNNVIVETQGVSNKQFNVSALLRNVETPIVTDNKIKLKFKSKVIKNHFINEIEDPRSKNAFKSALKNSYKVDLDLQISSPLIDEFVQVQIDKLEKEIEDLQKEYTKHHTAFMNMQLARPVDNLLNDDERIILQAYLNLSDKESDSRADGSFPQHSIEMYRLYKLAMTHVINEIQAEMLANEAKTWIMAKRDEIEELKKNDRY